MWHFSFSPKHDKVLKLIGCPKIGKARKKINEIILKLIINIISWFKWDMVTKNWSANWSSKNRTEWEWIWGDHLGILTASIRALISESIKLAPTLCKPVFSSSIVIWPLLSASSILNISLNPAISSSDKLSAITYKHKENELEIASVYCRDRPLASLLFLK